ncbi:hypothetical protein D3C72_1292160 [compost metagenome]
MTCITEIVIFSYPFTDIIRIIFKRLITFGGAILTILSKQMLIGIPTGLCQISICIKLRFSQRLIFIFEAFLTGDISSQLHSSHEERHIFVTIFECPRIITQLEPRDVRPTIRLTLCINHHVAIGNIMFRPCAHCFTN